jgi:hypothetical protein
MRSSVACLSAAAFFCLAGCLNSETADPVCTGILLSAPESDSRSRSFSVAELMAHSAAMGMTQQEAETLLYLEGITASDTLAPGEALCVDGKPG